MMQKQLENSTIQTYFKALSIQVNLSGLSFSIFNPIKEIVEAIYNFPINFQHYDKKETEQQVKSIFEKEQNLRQEFENIKVLHNTEYFTFIPKALYKEKEQSYHYLKYSVRVDSRNYIEIDDLDVIDVVNVYTPNVLVNNVIRNYYGVFEAQHTATSLMRMFLTHYASQPYDVVYVYTEKTFFYLAYFSKKKLYYFNRFNCKNEDDFLYYLLYSAEQLEIDMERVPFYINGDITEKSLLFKRLKIYIENVNIMIYKNDRRPKNMDESLFQQHFILTQVF